MTFSEVLYLAACDMSDENWIGCDGFGNEFSCHQVAYVETRGNSCITFYSVAYGNLMTIAPEKVGIASRKVRWPVRDYRTFMLLMASEAVK